MCCFAADDYKCMLFCSSLRVLTSIYSKIAYIHKVGQRRSRLLGLLSYHYSCCRPTVHSLSGHPDLVDWMATLGVVHSRSDFPVVDNEDLSIMIALFILQQHKSN